MFEYYQKWWENPDDIRAPIFSRLNDLVRSRIPAGRGRHALDVGAGTGTITSILRENGWLVTAVEPNPDFCRQLKDEFPDVRVLNQSIQNVSFDRTFELVTAIEVFQNLPFPELDATIQKISEVGQTLLANTSSRKSLHGQWLLLRGFKNDFVHMHTPEELERIIHRKGGCIIYRRGVGLITPISLLEGFKGVIVPASIAEVVNRAFEHRLDRLCHLYYVEVDLPSQM